MSRSASWVAFVERRHRLLLAGSLVITLASALSLLALRFEFDVLGMLPHGAPAFDNFRTFVADFGELDELVILAECPDTARLHAFADAFATRLRGLDSVTAVQGKLDFVEIQQGLLGTFLYNYVPVAAYDEIAARLTPDGIDAAVRADRAILQAPFDLSAAQLIRRDPLGFTRLAGQALSASLADATLDVSGGYISTKDGTALLILVRPTRSAFDIAFTTQFMERVRAAEAEARRFADAPADLRVGYTGSYAIALEDAATIKWDVARYTLLALVGVLTVFYLGYRSWRILPFVTYPVVVSTLLTFAASLLCYAQLDAVSISFAAILYGLSIDDGIHFYTWLMQERRQHDLRTAVARTLAGLGGANVVASGTTAAGFAVIGFSQLTGVSQLGFLTAIGMAISIVEFFVLYPALSFWMARVPLSSLPLETPRLGRLAAACARRPRAILIGVAATTLVLSWLARGVDFDVDLAHLRPRNTVAQQVQDDIAARFAAVAAAGAVLVRTTDLEAALEASEQVATRLTAYQGEGLVHAQRSVTALLPSLRTQRERLARFNALPRQRVVEDLRAALERHGFVPAQFAAFFEDFTRLHETPVQLGAPVLAAFAPVLARHIRQHAGTSTVATYVEPAPGVSLAAIDEHLRHDLPDAPFIVAGRSLLEHELGRLLRRELVGFCLASFVVNLILVLVKFPRLGTAMAILFPQALVIVGCLALMRVSGVGINPVNLIVVPLILGIGVDNCVYVVARYPQGGGAQGALTRGGRAVSIAALTTIAGFGFLAMSHYPALAGMGTLTALSLFACLVASLTLLPALLVLAREHAPAKLDSSSGSSEATGG
jgi:predicted RND superfamily exporter protein